MDYFYEHATKSDATPLWYGAQYGDEVPDRDTFFNDFGKHYFQDRQNRKGRCFHILESDKKIGQINYNSIQDKEVDIDIIIYDKDNWSKGYGSSAIKLMSIYLEEKYHVNKIWIDVHPDNTRAIKAYEKSGYEQSDKSTKNGVEYIRMARSREILSIR